MALSFDPHAIRYALHGRALDLSLTEMRVLNLLRAGAGQPVPMAAIATALYGGADASDIDGAEAALSQLRKRLRRAGLGEAITTVRGVGYVWEEPA